jgi:hypothetical protein
VPIEHFTVKALENNPDASTLILTEFRAITGIPEGVFKADDVEGTHGELVYKFPTASSTYFRTDLGTGVATGGYISCMAESGIEAYDDKGIMCQLTHGTNGGHATVTVTNYKAITINTNVKLHFSLKNIRSGAAPSITIEAYQTENRVRTKLSQATVAMSTVTSSTGIDWSKCTHTWSTNAVQAATKLTLTLTPISVLNANTSWVVV